MGGRTETDSVISAGPAGKRNRPSRLHLCRAPEKRFLHSPIENLRFVRFLSIRLRQISTEDSRTVPSRRRPENILDSAKFLLEKLIEKLTSLLHSNAPTSSTRRFADLKRFRHHCLPFPPRSFESRWTLPAQAAARYAFNTTSHGNNKKHEKNSGLKRETNQKPSSCKVTFLKNYCDTQLLRK